MECNNRLRELREQAELKRHELAVKLDVNPSTVYRWETGQLIPSQYLGALTRLFDVTSDHLLGFDSDEAKAGAA